jgi:hypothetical protein
MKLTPTLCIGALIAISTAMALAEPSRSETIDWLTRKLTNYSAAVTTTQTDFGRTSVYSSSYTIKRFSVEEDILIIETEFECSLYTGNRKSQQVALSDLSSRCVVEENTPLAGIKATDEPKLYWLQLSTTEPGRVLGKNLSSQRTFKGSKFSIALTDRELAERVAKALAHLIKLSGGKDEPF